MKPIITWCPYRCAWICKAFHRAVMGAAGYTPADAYAQWEKRAIFGPYCRWWWM